MTAQHPAAPETETDANGLRELLAATTAIRRSLPGELHGGPEAYYSEVFIEEAFAHHAPGPTHDPDLRKIWRADAALIAEAMRALPALLADLDAARERVRVVEGERDAAQLALGEQADIEREAFGRGVAWAMGDDEEAPARLLARATSAEAAHEAEKAAHEALVDLCQKVIDVHAHVVMDTDKDRELHARAIATFRAHLALLGGGEAR